MELSLGRPLDTKCREDKETAVYDVLDKLEIEYNRVDHKKADTMEECLLVSEMLGVSICKNLFLCNRQKTAFYLLMMPSDKPFKTKELSSQINSARLSFADADDMERLLNIKPGSVSVMGLMNDKNNEVSLLIDKELLNGEFFGCHPCVNTSSLKIKISDLLDKFLPYANHSYSLVEISGEI